MNAGAAKVVVDQFLKGFFEVLDALSAAPFTAESAEIGDATPERLAGYVERFPVVVRARVASGGAVALLFQARDAAMIGSLGGGSLVEPMDAAALQALGEVADAALGGAISAVGTACALDMSLTDTEAVQSPDDLAGYMGETCTAATAQFRQSGAADADVVFVYTQNLEDLCPAKLYSPAANQAQLSEQEMTDILSGFEVAQHDTREAAPAAGALAPPNLEMILDINLVVTARLGRVELPIQDILSLGPGSIIEVGHLVDEPVELLVNDKLIARGDVVVVDEKFGLRITEIVSTRERIASLG
jgi:flagellar motor switch protein FliN/FliY